MKELHTADTPPFIETRDVFDKHFGPSPPSVRVQFGALSHTGLVRLTNEDHYGVVERRRSRTILLTNLPEGYLKPADDHAYVMAVADGIRGAAFGDLASKMALRSGWELAPTAIKWGWIITDDEIEDLRQQIELIFRKMNQTLLETGQFDSKFAGMGTTLTGAYTVGPEAFVAHAGDSRAYLYRQGTMTQLTRDHTVAQQCLDKGLPVRFRSWFHILTNCLGGNDQEVQVEFHHFQLADSDQLLLCTDGLTDMVKDEEIADILSGLATPQEMAQSLVDLALERGGRDNVTVVLARYAI